MEKHIRFILLFIVFFLGIYAYQNEYYNVYAIELDNKVDLLIENKNIQKELALEIEEIQKEIDIIDEISNKNEIEIVTVSFIQTSTSSEEYIEKNEVDILLEEKNRLESKLKLHNRGCKIRKADYRRKKRGIKFK